MLEMQRLDMYMYIGDAGDAACNVCAKSGQFHGQFRGQLCGQFRGQLCGQLCGQFRGQFCIYSCILPPSETGEFSLKFHF